MVTEHSIKSYDEELEHLSKAIAQMGGLAEGQLSSAIQAVAKRDSDLASRVVSQDARVDELEQEVDALSLRMLALRQPVAVDLRAIVSSIKIASDIERIADYAANVAKRAMILNSMPPVKPVSAVPRMGRLVQEIFKEVLDALVERDADKALEVWKRDEEVDDMYTSIFRELITYMMEDPRTITACTHLLFIAKNIERIGDHATNIAELIYFLVHGKPLKGARPKKDTTTTTHDFSSEET
ncbi:MAG: phosphate signaling complex protein PhoU [Alphaproteobacteria bacterium]|jgi:phosphate transport system protein|nr:phosphate signaling complex protein PhoU [Alphaproteobacteria bacterium]